MFTSSFEMKRVLADYAMDAWIEQVTKSGPGPLALGFQAMMRGVGKDLKVGFDSCLSDDPVTRFSTAVVATESHKPL